ncbi:PQQ-dependent sugar dehydrogenase [Sphingomonas sp. SUN039]|uniref:PQQ-dependent sugar dehydrogenase n=1 Tax=Sphingomonas sp. SUN039 TaxID=2937787 RepID=UPI002164E3D7|nr:PQQ-dependent sugar dehydrogenase [Sphingomonas sp. SUN039]UVO55511.1 PQQ-dependent sugar dehydrogenase [Sphingomonas sp. SUN039]
MMKRAATALSLVLAACGQASTAQDAVAVGQAPITGPQTGATKPFVATPVATFDSPWAMTFLPDGRMLVTEKGGALKLVGADGKTGAVVRGAPAVDSGGQGGLMDVVLHPEFAENRMVYLSWSEAGPGGKGVALGRGRLADTVIQCIRAPCPVQPGLQGFTTIFRATPFVSGGGHYSGRIAFSPDGKYLYFTNGERQKFDPAQDKSATLGKVLRLTPDGKPAPDNPLAAQGFRPEVWSYGHRNLLGIAFDAQGRLWEQEMGPKGGDELNLILPGKNYGYPIVSNGDHYDGRNIPDHPTRPEFEAPKVSWNPVISPGGLIFYSGKLFPAWKGSAFIGGLSSQALVRISFDGEKAREAERFDMGKRIREVEQGPDGALYVLEDGAGGRLLRLTPKP